MTPRTRQSEIVNIIRQHGKITVDALAEKLSISKETIRRDLTFLSKAGRVQKFHGGASLSTPTNEGSFDKRMKENVVSKIEMAKKALTLVRPGETIFIDTGSTTIYFAEQLATLSDLKIITNSVNIAQTMATNDSSQVFLLGGMFKGNTIETIGDMVINQIASFRANHVFLTINSLDSQAGAMDFNIDEATIAKSMIKYATTVTILIDSSKFDTIASFNVCQLNQINNIVCDQAPIGELKQALKDANINILTINNKK